MGQAGGKEAEEEGRSEKVRRAEQNEKEEAAAAKNKLKEPKTRSRLGSKGNARRKLGVAAPLRLPQLSLPNGRLKLLKLTRTRDWLKLQRELVKGQEDFWRREAQRDGEEGGEAEGENQALSKVVAAFRGPSMPLGTLEEVVGDWHGIVSLPLQGEWYLRFHSMVDPELVEPGKSVLVQSSGTGAGSGPGLFIVGVLGEEAESLASCLRVDKAPTESFRDVGGLDGPIQALKEAVELPLLQPELFTDMGVTPPKGVILYGPPGTGKTLLAKAVANRTCATFLRVAGSELIQRHSGEGPKLVRELFKLADLHAPSIIFLDEIDAVGTKRYDTHSGGEKEIQRTLLELLNQLDGFASRQDIKVIMATNRMETLDPALIRPGRIDRKIEIPRPGPAQLRKIFQLQTERMKLGPDAGTLEGLGWERKELSGADLKALCTEAGLLCLRQRLSRVTRAHFQQALQTLTAHQDRLPYQHIYL